MRDRAMSRAVKRALDLVVSAVGLLVLSPALITVSVVGWLAIGPPLLFRQQRPGYKRATLCGAEIPYHDIRVRSGG